MSAVSSPVVGLVAGEASGDLLGAHLVQALRARRPELRFVGIAGPKMVAAGVDALFPMEKLAVRGYVEVLERYLEIISIRRQIKRHFLRRPPAVFIGIDAPDFNLGLELELKRAGVPTVHYVSPSIWAWRGERIHAIKRAVDRVLALFPFETIIYEKAGVPVSYVGHPLADLLHDFGERGDMRSRFGLLRTDTVVTLMPGSRISELQNMAELFVAGASRIAAANPAVKFLVPMTNRATRTLFEAALAKSGNIEVQILDGQSHEAIVAADVVLVASGTATLEAALLKRPMVIAYRMPCLSWWIMNSRRYLPYVGLPNILANEFVVPEFLQDDATPDNLARAVVDLLNDPPRCQSIQRRFSEMGTSLRMNTAQKAAEAIMPYLDSRSP